MMAYLLTIVLLLSSISAGATEDGANQCDHSDTTTYQLESTYEQIPGNRQKHYEVI